MKSVKCRYLYGEILTQIAVKNKWQVLYKVAECSFYNRLQIAQKQLNKPMVEEVHPLLQRNGYTEKRLMLLDHIKDVLQPAVARLAREDVIEELQGLIRSLEAVEEQLISTETPEEVARSIIIGLLELDADSLDGDSVLGKADEEECMNMVANKAIGAYLNS